MKDDMRYFILLILAVTVQTGCTSFRTTLMSRTENDSLYRDPAQHHCKRGIPVKLKVPSHVVVRIFEQQVLVQGTNGTNLYSFDQPQICVDTELFYTDKVFLVDFKRPAAGTLELGGDSNDGVAFDDEQYFSKIRAEVQERTLRDITSVIETFPKTKSAGGEQASSRLQTNVAGVSIEESLLAFERFDIADPYWEAKMHEFIDRKLRECGQCCDQKPCPELKNTCPAESLPCPQQNGAGVHGKSAGGTLLEAAPLFAPPTPIALPPVDSE